MPVRIGTRGSPLALVQADMVATALQAADPGLAEPGAIEIVRITTSGDRVQDRTLADIGGKGLFTKEIDQALLERRIDLAVHSMKDLPTDLPDGIVLAACLPRADPRDALLLRPGLAGLATVDVLGQLPHGARVGTASLRRQAQLLARRPDLVVEPMRGNVGTRLDKLARGDADATLLALAGLHRLGLQPDGMVVLSVEIMLPAVAQAAIGITARAADEAGLLLADRLDHRPTSACIVVERGFLRALDGSCRTPIAGLAVLGPDGIMLDGLTAAVDGSWMVRDRWREPAPRLDDLAALAGFGDACGRALAARVA